MTDLELRLLHCEKEPSEVALYDAADAFLAIGDEEMYHGLKYMGKHGKSPLITSSYGCYWYDHFGDKPHNLPREIFQPPLGLKTVRPQDSFQDAVRWLGKRLIELGMA